MKYITTMQTPLYKLASTGFYSAVRSLPVGSEVEVTQTGTDPKSERPIGYLATGEIIYTDSLTRVLDEVTAQSTRLWDWLIGIGIAAGVGYGIYRYNKKKAA